jgi:hypothetical protein
MAEICPVCDKEISKFSLVSVEGVDIHDTCRKSFYKNPEPLEQRRKELEEKSIYKSVYIKGGVVIKSFNMPFGDMVMFMVKWAIASIPAFIILAIIGAMFFAILTSLGLAIF